MRDGLIMVQDKIQTLVDTLVSYGVVCKRLPTVNYCWSCIHSWSACNPRRTICQSDSGNCGLYRRGLRHSDYIWCISRYRMCWST